MLGLARAAPLYPPSSGGPHRAHFCARASSRSATSSWSAPLPVRLCVVVMLVMLRAATGSGSMTQVLQELGNGDLYIHSRKEASQIAMVRLSSGMVGGTFCEGRNRPVVDGGGAGMLLNGEPHGTTERELARRPFTQSSTRPPSTRLSFRADHRR